MNDPLGDMLTRIRNAQLRGKSTVKTPASKLRAWVLDVLKGEGYIRGYESITGVAGHPELEISLKYFDAKKDISNRFIGQLTIFTPLTYLDPIATSPPSWEFALYNLIKSSGL